MSRLTNKNQILEGFNGYEIVKKLSDLEDIEEELGIDLVTLFKALKNGVYVKTKEGVSKHFTVHLMKWQQTSTYCFYYRPYSHIWLKDYGKTWALTKEELEND
jgi:hypothetical protein